MTSIEQYDLLLGQSGLHPSVAVIPLKSPVGDIMLQGDFYALYFRCSRCGDERYGCGCYDFRSATLVFKAPGEVIEIASGEQLPEVPLTGILFAPELFEEPWFDDKKDEYTFFSYRENESLHLSCRELAIIVKDMTDITGELVRERDCYTEHLLYEYLGLLLDHCLRFYNRQFILRSDLHQRTVVHARVLIEKYFKSERCGKTVHVAAENVHNILPFSIPYLDGLLFMEIGMKLPEYIRHIQFELALEQVRCTDRPIPEIVSDLGYPNVGMFNLLFRKLFGCSPEVYRKPLN